MPESLLVVRFAETLLQETHDYSAFCPETTLRPFYVVDTAEILQHIICR